MRHLVIGAGEVGTAIASIFNCDTVDKEEKPKRGTFDILHICIPYSEKFIDIVKEYQFYYIPKYTVIHSTVKPGTSKELGAIHSPVIGIHPYLETGIRTFTKFLGGERASEVADEFRRHGIKVYLFDKAETSELMKVLDTTFYSLCIEYTKHVKEQCDELGVPFEAWTVYNNNYNIGYEKMGYPEYTRPNLVPIMGPQGGHCTRNNCDLLDTAFTYFIKEINDNS